MPTAIEPFLTQEMLDRIAAMPETRRKAAMAVVAREEWERCAEDIFYWLDPNRHLIPYVYTQDPKPMHVCKLCSDGATYQAEQRTYHLLNRHSINVSKESERKAHFTELDTTRVFTLFPYFEPLIETWLNQQLFAIEKSRDMMATWLVTIMYTWDVLFHPGRQVLFQSEDASKTRELVRRAYSIYDNQPSWLKRVHPARQSEGSSRAGQLRVDSLKGSEILGLPQGSTKVRMYHPTGFFSDEAAFNPDAEESFAAIKPAIQTGGKYTAISSANPGWFMRICKDLIINA